MTAVDVELLHWPGDAARRDACAERGIPCLLLLGDGPPPAGLGPLEDWIRVPAGELDLLARMRRLSGLATGTADPPVVDEEGILHVGDLWTALSPTEAALARALSARFGNLVAREDLLAALRPPGDRRARTLDLQICRLRRRIATVGLVVSSIRNRGYVLEAAPPPRDPPGTRPS
ncbi:MAG: two-component system, OmpR family, response regulator [Actinomycetota bacterium]|jgi:hypothetical protein|nr:two-component system, OmpR family, response regulator [Actinomycetota bacterium]